MYTQVTVSDSKAVCKDKCLLSQSFKDYTDSLVNNYTTLHPRTEQGDDRKQEKV